MSKVHKFTHSCLTSKGSNRYPWSPGSRGQARTPGMLLFSILSKRGFFSLSLQLAPSGSEFIILITPWWWQFRSESDTGLSYYVIFYFLRIWSFNYFFCYPGSTRRGWSSWSSRVHWESRAAWNHGINRTQRL